jgi:RimJ/RimL family protein N-acetyltransferase
VHLPLSTCIVRDWASGDLPALVKHANNRNVWIHLRDRFPYPYTETDGRDFLMRIREQAPPLTVWAIEVDGEAAGGIGYMRLSDIERASAEIGYWLGEAYWGRGVMTDALKAVTADAFRIPDLWRVFAVPFADNVGSIRVLEKAGYVLEGRMRQSAIKDGVLRDQVMYGIYKPVA